MRRALVSLCGAFGLWAAVCGAAPPADVLAAHLDTSVSPAVDFFQYGNGGWLKANPIPPSESSWGIGSVLREQLYVNLRQINEAAAAGSAPAGSDTRKLGDFWAAAMDTARTEQLGSAPIKAELARIAAVRTGKDALDLAFAWRPMGVDAFFNAFVSQDSKNSDEMAVTLWQGGLGLPERDFYFNPEKGVAHIRAEYQDHIGRTLALAGRKPAGAAAVLAFETELAKASRRLEDLRDPEKNYNKMDPAEFTGKCTPSILWPERLASWTLRPAAVIVGQPEFYAALDALLARTPAAVLQDYLAFHLVSTFAATLSQPFVDEDFHFYGQVLQGQKQPRDRWKRVLDAQERAMGMLLGRQFVAAYFPPAAKKRYEDLVEAVRAAYKERIEHLDWMSPATKAKAQVKLAGMTKKVGYPDTWKDFSALVVGRDSYCENMKNAARWRFQDMVGKFGKPVDRTEWEMTPQTYNAYYNPSNNEIVLPAAQFMVPGIKDADLDDALVYGYSAASTIGHEITHGFDDEGRQFDAKGNLAEWWTKEDAARFQAKAELMVKQFDGYEPIPGLHINGKASLGENIADYGGLLLGIDAFKRTEQYKKGEPIAGLLPMQRFFLGYTLGWLLQQREETLRSRLLSDVHAPAKWRVLGPLSNLEDFHQAFGVKPGQPMWRAPEARPQIW